MRILVLLLASVLATCAAQWPELRGIVHVDGADKPAAVLVMSKVPNASKVKTAPGSPAWTILRMGETDSGFDENIEMMSIDAIAGVVKLRHRASAEATELKLAALLKGEKYLFHLERSPLGIAIECYQRLSGRTVIYSPQLPIVEVDVHIPADQDKTNTLAGLAKAIEAHEAVVVDHAEKFAFAVPTRHKQLVASLPATPQAKASSPAKVNNIIPAGLIKFASADVLHVIEFYSDLTQRTVLRPAYFPHSHVTLRSQTPLDREEVIWMIEAALRLCSLVTVPAGEKFVYVVPPERTLDLPAFDLPKKIPGASGAIRLVDVDPQQLLEIYAAVTGRKAVPVERNVPHVKITLRSHAPLTPSEAAFALEAVAALNGLALQPTGENEIKLLPLALARLKTN